MAGAIRLAPGPPGQSEKLISHVDERHAPPSRGGVDGEDSPIEGQRLLDIPALECDVVDPHEPRSLRHLAAITAHRESSAIPSARRTIEAEGASSESSRARRSRQ